MDTETTATDATWQESPLTPMNPEKDRLVIYDPYYPDPYWPNPYTSLP